MEGSGKTNVGAYRPVLFSEACYLLPVLIKNVKPSPSGVFFIKEFAEAYQVPNMVTVKIAFRNFNNYNVF